MNVKMKATYTVVPSLLTNWSDITGLFKSYFTEIFVNIVNFSFFLFKATSCRFF